MLDLEIFAEAALAVASDRLSVFILLLNSLNKLVAEIATKGANLQLGLYFGCARHCALNRHDLAETDRRKVSDFMDGWHVVDADLEPL